MHHVSTSPPFHPGQSDFPSPVGDPGISPLDLPASHRSLNAGSYAPLVIPVYPMARHITAVTSFTGHGVPSCAALAPARAESPFACNEALPCCSVMSKHHVGRHYSSFIAHMGSCAEPNPSLRLRSPISEGPCRLLPVPAGRWSFPTLSPQSIYRRLDPYPVVFFRCTYSFLPGRHRPHVMLQTFGTPNNPCNATSTGTQITRLQSFSYVQAPILARPPDCTYRYGSQHVGFGCFRATALFPFSIRAGCPPELSTEQPGRLRHAMNMGLPLMNCGIASCPNRVIDTTGLSPVELRPCRPLPQHACVGSGSNMPGTTGNYPSTLNYATSCRTLTPA